MNIATIHGPFSITTYSNLKCNVHSQDLLQQPGMYSSRCNTGDFFVCEIAERMLEYERVYTLSTNFTQKEIDFVNEHCDFMVWKGGNYVKRDFISRYLGYEKLKQIKIPIILMGVGLQSDLDKEQIPFTEEEKSCLHFIHDSCECSSVRGFRTAEELERIGITNAMVTGCPVLYWSLEPTIKIPPISLDRVGFGFRRVLYCRSDDFLARQFRVLDQFRHQVGELTVMLQGEEVEERSYYMATRYGLDHYVRTGREGGSSRLTFLETVPLDLEELARQVHENYKQVAGPKIIDYYLNHLYFTLDLEDYLNQFRSFGFMTGFRLHGNLLALSQATPALYWVYDNRTLEICETLSIPYRHVETADEPIDAASIDYTEFEKKYSVYFAEMRRCLERNKLSHRLGAAEPAGDLSSAQT